VVAQVQVHGQVGAVSKIISVDGVHNQKKIVMLVIQHFVQIQYNHLLLLIILFLLYILIINATIVIVVVQVQIGLHGVQIKMFILVGVLQLKIIVLHALEHIVLYLLLN